MNYISRMRRIATFHSSCHSQLLTGQQPTAGIQAFCLLQPTLPVTAHYAMSSEKVVGNAYHVPRNILPNDETVSSYKLKPRRHNRELVDKTSRLVQSSVIVCNIPYVL